MSIYAASIALSRSTAVSGNISCGTGIQTQCVHHLVKQVGHSQTMATGQCHSFSSAGCHPSTSAECLIHESMQQPVVSMCWQGSRISGRMLSCEDMTNLVRDRILNDSPTKLTGPAVRLRRFYAGLSLDPLHQSIRQQSEETLRRAAGRGVDCVLEGLDDADISNVESYLSVEM